ncbi:MAG: type II secretion system protein [Planctomycetota bacterium]
MDIRALDTEYSRSGFTLVELLIVVLILGILAAVVVPQFSAGALDAKGSALEADLTVLRTAIEMYHLQHKDTFPGTISGSSTWDNFVVHLTKQTDKNGDPGTKYGPYLRTGIPANPLNGSKLGTIVGSMPANGDDSSGWYYKPSTGEIRANSAVTLQVAGESVKAVKF